MEQRADLYLHSTMLLLYLLTQGVSPSGALIYIPLCFYFIQLPHELHEVPAYDLHSTMLLSRILATFRSCYIQLN